MWERVTRGQELKVRRWAGAKSWEGGHCKNAGLHVKRSGKPLQNGKERSTRVNLNFNKIILAVVKARFIKG